MVSALHGLDTAFFATPAHHGGILGQASFQDFIPAYHLAAQLLHNLLHPLDEVALQLVFYRGLFGGFQSQFLGQSLTFRTTLPGPLAGFVASYMEILGWEEFCHFPEYIFYKFKTFLVAYAEIAMPVRLADRVGRVATQLWIYCHHFFAVSWHLYLRKHLYEVVCSHCQNLPYIFLGQVAAIGSFHTFLHIFPGTLAPPLVPVAFCTETGQLGKLRVFVHLESPACRIGQVQMQSVQLIASHFPHLLQDKVFPEEMPAAVQHEASVAEFRLIGDGYSWNFPILCQLPQSLHAIE